MVLYKDETPFGSGRPSMQSRVNRRFFKLQLQLTTITSKLLNGQRMFSFYILLRKLRIVSSIEFIYFEKEKFKPN